MAGKDSHYDNNDTCSSRDLPPLHEVLGDILLQSPTGQTSRQSSSESLQNPAEDDRNQRLQLQLAPIASPSQSLSPTPSPEASTSMHRLRSRASLANTSSPYSPTQAVSPHSYDLFDYSPSQGLVHKKSSKSQEDLDESKPKPRPTSVNDISRKYLCPTCGKRFTKPSTLRNHIMTHTGEKPFICPHPDCGRPFSMASNMHRHMRTHTSGSAFQIVHDAEEETSSGKTSADEEHDNSTIPDTSNRN